MCQFGFLTFFEDPHIERTYGERVPLAQRVPLENVDIPTRSTEPLEDDTAVDDSTPSQTDASTDTETDEPPEIPRSSHRPRRSTTSTFATFGNQPFNQQEASRLAHLTQHDLNARYFQHEAVVFTNWDPLRSRDIGFGLAVFYAVCLSLLPQCSSRARLVLYFGHAVVWRLFHSFGLGLMLKKQSQSKWLVRHFIKHYYSSDPVRESFKQFIGIYNLSLIMTYLSFGLLALHCYQWPWSSKISMEAIAFRHITGAMLLALHAWTARATFAVLGDFGWFVSV